jgi:hypothetical protein
MSTEFSYSGNPDCIAFTTNVDAHLLQTFKGRGTVRTRREILDSGLAVRERRHDRRSMRDRFISWQRHIAAQAFGRTY